MSTPNPLPSDPLLRATNLSKRYDDQLVVNDASLSLACGEVLGLLGPNGAGKSTIVGMLYGVVTPTSGAITLCGYDMIRQGKKARSQLGIVPQGDHHDSDLSVRGSLLAFARYHSIAKRKAVQKVDELLEKYRLAEHQKKSIEALSGGLKRRLALARALLCEPKVIFLDEPTTGLDPDARQEFWGDVLTLKSSGCGVLLTTHYMEEAERLCDQIVLLQKGNQIDQGKPDELILRHCGKEVVEINGIAEERLQQLATKHSTWCRRFAGGFLIGLSSEQLWQTIAAMLAEESRPDTPRQLRVTRRNATLDEVFLLITGSSLS